MISQITTHITDGLARLIEQYKNATKFKLWLSTYLRRFQTLEDAVWEVLTERGIDDAIGKQLDNIGAIVNRARGGLSDDDYRIALKAEILILRSDGRMNDVIAVAALALPSGFTFSTRDEAIATIRFVINEPVTFDASVVWHMIRRTKAGGVRLVYEFVTAPLDEYFVWKDDGTSADVGFGDSVSGVGGKLSCALPG